MRGPGLVLLVGAVSGLAACATTTSSTAKQPARLTTIKMLTVPYFAPEQVAIAEGFFRQHGLNVQLVPQSQEGLSGIQAVIANQVQTGQSFGAFVPIEVNARGTGIKAVVAGATSNYGENRFYTMSDSTIRSCKDFAGKKVGIVAPGTMGDVVLQAYLQKCGLTEKDVQVLTVPTADMCTELAHGQIDVAGMLSIAWGPCEQQEGSQIRLLFADKNVLPTATLYSAYDFTDSYIAAHPQVVRDFVAAIRQTTVFIAAHPAEARQIISKATGIAAKLLVVPKFPAGDCINATAAAQWPARWSRSAISRPGP
jgi:ABC-type nitrate/sulfonate/bicarbonate transport system substrate-binding protein